MQTWKQLTTICKDNLLRGDFNCLTLRDRLETYAVNWRRAPRQRGTVLKIEFTLNKTHLDFIQNFFPPNDKWIKGAVRP